MKEITKVTPTAVNPKAIKDNKQYDKNVSRGRTTPINNRSNSNSDDDLRDQEGSSSDQKKAATTRQQQPTRRHVQNPVHAEVAFLDLGRDLVAELAELPQRVLEVPELALEHLAHGKQAAAEADVAPAQSQFEETPGDAARALGDVVAVRGECAGLEAADDTKGSSEEWAGG